MEDEYPLLHQLLVTVPGGCTVVFDVFDDGSKHATAADVLAFVEDRTGVPTAALQLRRGCAGGAPLADDAPLPEGQTLFEARLAGGLKGGKGGFGAMLRALAKQNTGHKTTDFGACRDLNGRRLRHVNNDIKLQKWTEARERKEEAKRRGIELDSDDEEQVAASESGIKGWHLSVPSWIEHVKQRETKAMRRKTASKRRWEDEEEDVEEAGVATRALRGVVTMVDGVRGSFAIVDSDIYVPFTANAEDPPPDWSTVLQVGDRMDVKAVAKTQGRNKWYGYKAVRVAPDDHGSAPSFPSSSSSSSSSSSPLASTLKRSTLDAVSQRHHVRESTKSANPGGRKDPLSKVVASSSSSSSSSYVDQDRADEAIAESMSAAVAVGLAREKMSKKRAVVERNSEQLAMLPVDLEGHTKKKPGMGNGVVRWDADRHERATAGWLGLLAGQLDFAGDGIVHGVSEFASVCVLGVSLTRGKWYYEAELRTSGVMQVGWADQLFKGDSENGDGVGDDEHSWAYDGCRQQKWNGESPVDYGAAWAAGDVVGCLLDLDEGRGTVAFTLNGKGLSSAFELELEIPASKTPSDTAPLTQAASLVPMQQGFYPAAAVEDGEVLALHVTAASLRYGPPEGFRAVADAMAVKPLEPISMLASGPTGVIADESNDKERTSVLAVDGAMPAVATYSTTLAVSADETQVIPPKPREAVVPELLDLSTISTLGELEVLGLDRLKAALMFLGVKCGGTLHERAQRLLALKGIPKEAIDPSLLASTGGGKRRRRK